MFSRRLPGSLQPTRLARAADALRSKGIPFVDLTESNPTRAGFQYPEQLLAPLGSPNGLVYAPAPLGLDSAREAVRSDYARRGLTVAVEDVAVTASTSESYSFLFKLLCDAGDNVLVPEPSYPLFRYLTGLDAIQSRPYRLSAADGWTLDVASLDQLVDRRTRAVLVVTPNNPTGTCIRTESLTKLGTLCARRGLVLIGDEVFIDYPISHANDTARSVLEQSEALTFSLGGLSKTAGLPQLKFGWIAAGGPPRLVRQALARLEVVADAYLSVSTPIQLAAGVLMQAGATIRAQIVDRVRANHEMLSAAARDYPACRVPPVEGGWSAVVQAPALMDDESRAVALLEEQHVLVHPGSLFDFERGGHFVISLLPRPAEFGPAVRRMLAALDAS